MLSFSPSFSLSPVTLSSESSVLPLPPARNLRPNHACVHAASVAPPNYWRLQRLVHSTGAKVVLAHGVDVLGETSRRRPERSVCPLSPPGILGALPRIRSASWGVVSIFDVAAAKPCGDPSDAFLPTLNMAGLGGCLRSQKSFRHAAMCV